MAEFIERVTAPAYVLCFKLMGFTHICSGFGGCAIGRTLVQGVQGRRKKQSCTCLTKVVLFQYLPKVFCNQRHLFPGKMVKMDFAKAEELNSFTSCNRASIQCETVCQTLGMKLNWQAPGCRKLSHWWRWITNQITPLYGDTFQWRHPRVSWEHRRERTAILGGQRSESWRMDQEGSGGSSGEWEERGGLGE